MDRCFEILGCRVTGPDNLALLIDDIGHRHALYTKCFGRGRGPPPVASPDIERVRPTALVHVIAYLLHRFIDAQGHDDHLALPIHLASAQGLQFGHWLLARATPRRLKIQNHYLAAQIGELYFLFADDGSEFNLRSDRLRR